MRDFIRRYKEYVITTVIAFAIAVVIVFSRGIFGEESMDMVFTIVCDAFFIPGILFLCVGLMVYASNEGLFLAFSYGCKVIGRTITAKKDEKLIDEKYHEYYARQMQKKVKCKHFLMIGLVFVGISILFIFCSLAYKFFS